MTFWEALILGLVQGLTEYLPVSSSGHLEIGSHLFGLREEDNLLFAVAVHVATALSTVVVYRSDISNLAKGLLKFERNSAWRYGLLVILSMVPVAVVGIFFEDEVNALFTGNLLLVGCMLIVTSLLLTLTHWSAEGERSINAYRALVIGLTQAFAVLPGISRSGATISVAVLLGVKRAEAARFSFLMVLVPIFGAGLLKFVDYLEGPVHSSIGWLPLVVGFMAAFLSGVVACRWMVRLVVKGGLIFFAAYCLLVGLLAIIATFA